MRCRDLQAMDDARKDSRNAAQDAQRKEFEEWYVVRHGTSHGLHRHDDGDYAFKSTRDMWEAWQSARAKKVKLPEKYYPSYDPDTGAFMGEWERGDWMHIDDVRDAIRAAGYEVEND